MNRFKKILGLFWLSPLLICAFLLNSCLLEDGLFSSVEVRDFAVVPQTIAHGAQAHVTGIVESDSSLSTMTFAVYDEDGVTELVNIASVTMGAVTGKSMDLDQTGTTLKVSDAACAGHYLLQLIARDKSGERRTVMAPFQVTNPQCVYGKPDSSGSIHTGVELATVNRTLGSSGNSAPGSIDLDDFSTYTHAQAKPVSGLIDLYYGQNPADLSDRLMTPADAKAKQIGSQNSGPASWSQTNATPLRQLVFSKTQFQAIATQGDIDALWSQGTSISSALVVVGNIYLAKTDKGKTVIFRISALTAGSSGSVTLDSYR